MRGQLALFPIAPGTLVRKTITYPDGNVRVHEGRVTLATSTRLYYRCDKAGCMCRADRHDRAYAPHGVWTPRP